MKLSEALTKCIFVLLGSLHLLNASSQTTPNATLRYSSFDVTISTVLKTLNTGKIEQLQSQYYYVPYDNKQQQCISIKTFSNPQANKVRDNEAYFEWDSLYNEYLLGYTARVQTTLFQYPIDHCQYPHQNIHDSLQSFLSFDQIINSNEDIRVETKILALGEKDLYSTVFKIGKWINEHIKYVSSSYSKIHPATVVYNSGVGDCDELSVLYLSMLRTVNIPSRLVNGVAKGKNDYNFHTWIEVYFPDAGWVPFDATHAQFGVIDKYHIKLFHYHTNHEIVRSVWQYYPHFGNVEIRTKEFSTVKVKEVFTGENVLNPFDIQLQMINGTINTRSYLPILVTCKNNTPYYFSNKIQIKLDESTRLAKKTDDLLSFGPYEARVLYFTVKLGNVDKKKEQLTNILLHDLFGTQQEIQVHFSPEGKNINKIQAEEIIKTWKND